MSQSIFSFIRLRRGGDDWLVEVTQRYIRPPIRLYAGTTAYLSLVMGLGVAAQDVRASYSSAFHGNG